MGTNQKSSTTDQVNQKPNKLLQETQSIIKDALDRLGYPDEVYELLKDCIRMNEVRIPVQMDDSSTKVFTAYRFQHNDAIGPTIGGIRFHPSLTKEEIVARSIWMGIRAGILDLPLGGAQGGIVCDPRNLTFRELESLSRGYIRAMFANIGHMKDILSSDSHTNAQMIAWMMDEHRQIHEANHPGLITGKPVVLGGTQGREFAVAKGLSSCIQEAAPKRGIDIEGAKVVIQGFGRIGSFLAKSLHDQGAKVIGISDAYGGLYEPDGLDIDYLLDRRDSFGAVTNLFSDTISNDELLELDCDILVPAAVENQITAQNAKKVQARIIIEAASDSISQEAIHILTDRNILTVPNLLASSGSLLLSYFEWVQNNQGYYWTEKEVNVRLELMMKQAFQNVYEFSKMRRVNMQLASYMIGVRKMAEASRFRGWV